MAIENSKKHMILAIPIFSVAFWLYIYRERDRGKKQRVGSWYFTTYGKIAR
jgi:cbb3-type cytochrome oxidase subunit 3